MNILFPPSRPSYPSRLTLDYRELQHPRPHHAVTFDNFAGMGNMGGMNMGRERAMSVVSTDSFYYPNPPVDLSPNHGRDYRTQSFHPNR